MDEMRCVKERSYFPVCNKLPTDKWLLMAVPGNFPVMKEGAALRCQGLCYGARLPLLKLSSCT
eukprot:1146110-Pelagomonas_calceolata.AAC.9